MSEVATREPQLRFPEFSDSLIKGALGDYALIKRGAGSQYIEYSKDSKDSIRLIRIGDFLGGDAVFVRLTNAIQRFLLDEGDILIAGTGATAGITFLVPTKFVGMAYSYNAPKIKVHKDNVSFFYQYLISPKIKIQQIRLFTGNAQPFLDTNAIKGFSIFKPPLQEQQKIAAFLAAVDSKIEQLSKKQALLGEYKKGLMQQIFSQAIRFKANDGSDFPDWEEKKLGDLSVVISDGNYGELYPTSSDFKLTGVPFLRANNIKSLKIDGTDTKYITEEQHSLLTSGHLQTNDILITTRGVLGNLAIVESTHNGSNINAQICLLRVTNTSELNHFYLLFVLDHRDSKKQYKAFETGTALKQLPKGNLRKIKLKLPTLFEQNKIANFLSSIDTKIEQVDKQLDESKQFKKALLQQMFV